MGRGGVDSVIWDHGLKKLTDVARGLRALGLAVIPVGPDKRPLVKGWDKYSLDLEAREADFDKMPWHKAAGVAVVAGLVADSQGLYDLVVIDCDEEECFEALDKWSPGWSTELCHHPWALCVRTGPRIDGCNKHEIRCEAGRCCCGDKCEDAVSVLRGMAIFVRVPLPCKEDVECAKAKIEEFKRRWEAKIRRGNKIVGDLKFAESYQVVYGQHPSGLSYEPVSLGAGVVLSEEEFKRLMEALKEARQGQAIQAEARAVARLRELSDTEILEIANLLKPAYRPGNRQYIALYLSGWLAKAGVSPVSAVKVVKALYDSTNDTDPLKTRLAAVVYSYKKAGVDIAPYAEEIEKAAGVRPYGIDSQVEEEEVKGRTGLQEVLEGVLGEAEALAVIQRLQEILNAVSPFRDSIFELLDYEKGLYAVANLRRLIMARARRDGDKVVYKERVAAVAPTEVEVYESPIGLIRKYKVKFEGNTLSRPIIVGPATADELADRLVAEGLVYHRRLIHDVLSALLNAYIRAGRAKVVVEMDKPGFYLIDGQVKASGIEIQDPDPHRLREALQLLNELVEKWFSHAAAKFAVIIKWAAVAPFAYVLKQRGRWVRHLYLYGRPDAFKTTMGRIALWLWGRPEEKAGGSIDTPARLGKTLSETTLPVLINEPGPALMKPELVDLLKNATDSTVVRGKFERGVYVEYPALRVAVFTSNKFLPEDDALLKRMRVIAFSANETGPRIYGEKWEEAKEKFKEVEAKLPVLTEIGKCIATAVVRGEVQVVGEESGKALLEHCYNKAGLEAPWLSLEYEEEYDYAGETIMEFKEAFKKLVNDLYARYVSRLVEVVRDQYGQVKEEHYTAEEVDFEKKVEVLLRKNAIPGARLKNNKVVINKKLLEELGLKDRLGLKDLADLTGWEYRKYTEREGDKVVNYAAVLIDYPDFLQFVSV